MTEPHDERLEAILREMERQDAAWQRAWEVLARLGDVEVAVPRDVLARIAGPDTDPAAPPGGVRA